MRVNTWFSDSYAKATGGNWNTYMEPKCGPLDWITQEAAWLYQWLLRCLVLTNGCSISLSWVIRLVQFFWEMKDRWRCETSKDAVSLVAAVCQMWKKPWGWSQTKLRSPPSVLPCRQLQTEYVFMSWCCLGNKQLLLSLPSLVQLCMDVAKFFLDICIVTFYGALSPPAQFRHIL